MIFVEYINKEELNRVKDFRNYVYSKALEKDEDLFPSYIVEVMNKANRSGKFKDILFHGFSTWFGRLLLLVDIYQSCGFSFPEEIENEISVKNREIYHEYFH